MWRFGKCWAHAPCSDRSTVRRKFVCLEFSPINASLGGLAVSQVKSVKLFLGIEWLKILLTRPNKLQEWVECLELSGWNVKCRVDLCCNRWKCGGCGCFHWSDQWVPSSTGSRKLRPDPVRTNQQKPTETSEKMTKQYNNIQQLYQKMFRWFSLRTTIEFDGPMHLWHARDMPVTCPWHVGHLDSCCNVLYALEFVGRRNWEMHCRTVRSRKDCKDLIGSWRILKHLEALWSLCFLCFLYALNTFVAKARVHCLKVDLSLFVLCEDVWSPHLLRQEIASLRGSSQELLGFALTEHTELRLRMTARRSSAVCRNRMPHFFSMFQYFKMFQRKAMHREVQGWNFKSRWKYPWRPSHFLRKRYSEKITLRHQHHIRIIR